MRKDFRALTGYQRIGCEAQFRRTRNPQPRGDPEGRWLVAAKALGRSSRKTKQRKKASKTLAFFCLGGGAFPGSCLWRCFAGGRSLFAARRIRAFVHGKIFAKCVLERLAAAIFRRDASPNTRRWQNARELPHPTSGGGKISCRGAFLGGRPWQYSRAMRSRAATRGNILASCIPEGASDGKRAPSWQHIAAMYPKRAGFGKICALCIRKAPQTAFRECMARRSCQGGALFAALAPRIIHGALI